MILRSLSEPPNHGGTVGKGVLASVGHCRSSSFPSSKVDWIGPQFLPIVLLDHFPAKASLPPWCRIMGAQSNNVHHEHPACTTIQYRSSHILQRCCSPLQMMHFCSTTPMPVMWKTMMMCRFLVWFEIRPCDVAKRRRRKEHPPMQCSMIERQSSTMQADNCHDFLLKQYYFLIWKTLQHCTGGHHLAFIRRKLMWGWNEVFDSWSWCFW